VRYGARSVLRIVMDGAPWEWLRWEPAAGGNRCAPVR